jgi:hypothetical protein
MQPHADESRFFPFTPGGGKKRDPKSEVEEHGATQTNQLLSSKENSK